MGGCRTRTHTIAGTQRYQITLGYDNVGRISRKTEVVAGASHVFDFGYDLDGQLTDVWRDGSLVEHYAFDNNGNRTSTLATTASYDDQDRLIQQGGLSYTFDVDGYLTNRGADTFAYSARGELLSATAGGQTVTYQYDAMARRVARTAAGATTQYLYGNPGQPFQLTASRAPDNTLTVYTYGPDGDLAAFERGGQRYYVATDHLGTPKIVTDNAGNVVKQAEYDAWGMKLSDTNPALDIPVGFAGGIQENTTGLVRFGFRDYEPGTGRWDARDPILFGGGQGNLFGYVSNSPVNYTDSSGLMSEAKWNELWKWLNKTALSKPKYGSGANKYDCSGLVKSGYSQTGVGINLSGSANDIYNNSKRNGLFFTDMSRLKPGDLIYFDYNKKGHVSHIGIFVKVNSDGDIIFTHMSGSGLHLGQNEDSPHHQGSSTPYSDARIGFSSHE